MADTLTLDETARALGITRRTLDRRRAAGSLGVMVHNLARHPAHAPMLRVLSSDLANYLEGDMSCRG